VCESGETGDCPDCQQAPCVCGDGVCEQYRCNELQQNCPADCGSGPGPDPCAGSYCGDGVCRPECGEDYWNCNAYYGGDCN
ncbi:MAG: hypothetical protein JXB30_07620, partial [Anaerolineae bacterium]|nr:hypothetical protein [Anaerolineae bacterium]